MTVFCVEYFYAKPSFSEKLYSALERLVEPSRAENGCIQYDLLQDEENSKLFIIIVQFESKETMMAHEQQRHVINFSENEMNQYCEKVHWNDANKKC